MLTAWASLYQEMISFACASSNTNEPITIDVQASLEGLQPKLKIQVEASGVALPPFSPEDVLAPLQASWENLRDDHLGISVAHAIAIQMDGSLRVQDGTGPDSALCLTFPVQRIVETIVEPSVLPNTGSSTGTVLVVDDNPSVRRLTCGMIKRLTGEEAYGVATGNEALAFLREVGRDIGIVIMDIILEGESGFDIYHDIRSTHPHLSIVFISGYAGDVRLSKTLNTDPLTVFLSKPFDMTQLQSVLAKSMSTTIGV